MGEKQRAQASIKRKRQHKIVDKTTSYGPPDKSEHFLVSDDDDDFDTVPKQEFKSCDQQILS